MKRIFKSIDKIGILMLFTGLLFQCNSPEQAGFPDAGTFSDPPVEYKAYTVLGMMLNDVDEERAREQLRHYHERGFVGILVVSNRDRTL